MSPGVGDYQKSNTRLLLEGRNWRGLILDGSDDNISNIRRQPFYWRCELRAVSAFLDAENINEQISAGGLTGEIGLLSIDVDGNDYWLWKALDIVSPAVLIVEYNAVLGDRHELSIPYTADFLRSKAHYSHLYFGASIRALVKLGEVKGYRFVGTSSSGCNAFFIRRDVAEGSGSVDKVVCAFPSTDRESPDTEGNLSFVSAGGRLKSIEGGSCYGCPSPANGVSWRRCCGSVFRCMGIR